MKLIIADDHSIVRSGVSHLLKQHSRYEVLAEVSDLISLVESVNTLVPDLIILDYRIPGGDAFATALQLMHLSNTGILMYTACESPALLQEICDSPIEGIVLKQDTCSELLIALDTIRSGRRYISESVKTIIKGNEIRLTPRELQILNMIMMGFSRSMISNQLSVSPETVKSHRKNLMRKLDANNVSSLLHRAQELKLCEH